MNNRAHATQPMAAAKYTIGDVSCTEAWEQLRTNNKAQLVDVRTQAEWVFVGLPDLSSLNKQVITLSWKNYPGFSTNQQFAEQLEAHGIRPDAPLYFICRSGGRSYDAALHMAQRGYQHCFNVAGGFEGEPDEKGHRGKRDGWKAAALPWGQN